MIEISPRITYSPEGVLELHKNFEARDEKVEARYSKLKDDMDTIAGCEVSEEGDETIVRVEIGEVVSHDTEPDFHSQRTKKLIENLTHFTYFGYDEVKDGVFSLEFLSDLGTSGVVYPQFQRWLNSEGSISEDVAKRCIDAMAYPLGTDQRRQAKRDFSYRTDGKSVAAGVGGFTYGILSPRDDFGVSRLAETAEGMAYENGKVSWNNLSLSTLGSCACWGASGDERDRVYIHPEVTSRLYEMQTHNVDNAEQSLSLVLGAATLAYEAAKYTGTEDILADAAWRGSR